MYTYIETIISLTPSTEIKGESQSLAPTALATTGGKYWGGKAGFSQNRRSDTIPIFWRSSDTIPICVTAVYNREVGGWRVWGDSQNVIFRDLA